MDAAAAVILSNTLHSTVMFSFSSVEGYGSIRPDDGGTEVFVHSEVLQAFNIRSLAEGSKVEFCTELDDEFKLWAIDVRGVDSNSAVNGAYRKPSCDACTLSNRRGVVLR